MRITKRIAIQIPERPQLPQSDRIQIFISFAWGDDRTDEGRLRQHAVETLEARLIEWGYDPIRDKNHLRTGDLISNFMKRIGRADHVLVILSEKYLKSPYCMTELYYLYISELHERDEFLKRIIPVVLPDARIDDWRGRRDWGKYWRTEYEEMKQSLEDLGAEDVQRYHMVRCWHAMLGDMLSFLSDKLTPRTWATIEQDDFASVRALLPRP